MNFYRVGIGSVLGYILTAQLIIAMTIILPFDSKAESILFSNLMSFAIWVVLFVYCFRSISIKNLLIQFISLGIVLYFFNEYFGRAI